MPIDRLVLLVVCLSCLIGAPVAAAEQPAQISLDLPHPAPEVPTESASSEEIQMKAARAINPLARIIPLAAVAPLSIVGLSIADTSPFLYATDPFAWVGMRSAGLSLMAGGMALGITFDVLARAEHYLVGEAWHERLGVMIAGVALAATGYALTSYGTNNAAHGGVVGLTTGFTIGGAVAWNAGMVMLVIDTVKFGFEDKAKLSAVWRPGAVQGAGVYAAPVPGGVTAGFGLRW